MKSVPNAPLRNREPEPGLINLGLPLPSIPILSPLLSPVVGGAPAAQPTTPPASSPPPTKPAPPAPPAPPSQPPASSPPSGGSSGGGTPPSSGGNSGNSGNSGGGGGGGNGNPSPGGSGGSGGTVSSPSSAGSSNSGGSAAQGVSGTSPSDVVGPVSVSGGTTFRITPTGAVALPLNNDNPSPSSGNGSSGSTDPNASGGFADSTQAHNVPLASTGPNGASGTPHITKAGGSGASGGSSGGSGGDDPTSDPNSGNSAPSASQSHMSPGAVGGIVVAAVLACMIVVFFVLRRRHIRRKSARHVEWVNGYVTEGGSDMQQRVSVRSSWGTPIEHRFSDPSNWIIVNPTSDGRDGTQRSESPSSYGHTDTRAPVLPMPVHSPFDGRPRSPEDPFSDVATPAQPLKRMSSLSIRLSLISTGSDPNNPFDDAHQYIAPDPAPTVGSPRRASASTFGHGLGSGFNTLPAKFPMPPPSSGSVSTVFALNSPTETLRPPPDILINFPDSPVSPTFAATGTSSYPRRASVRQLFLPSQARRDELRLEKGDAVSVVSVYEDGWAFVQKEKNKERGLVPLTCLELDNP